MSAITTVYDILITRIAAVLTGHYRLSNPYKLEENAETFLRIGYGLAIGDAVNTLKPMTGCLFTQRNFILSISRRYAATESNAVAKATTEKQIMEDLFLLINDFHQNTTLTNGNRVVKFESDSGINYVQGETDKFMYTSAVISIEYFETLT